MHSKYKEPLAGAIFIGFGIFFLANALTKLDIGTSFKMGPGYFAVLLSALLILLGIAIGVRGLLFGQVAGRDVIPWRGIVLIAAAPIVFAITVKPLGLAFALVLTSLLSALASRSLPMRHALALSLGLMLLCVLVFSLGLGIPLDLFGSLIK